MNGKHAIYRVYQALCAGMLSLFPAGRQTLVQGDGCITRIPELLKTHAVSYTHLFPRTSGTQNVHTTHSAPACSMRLYTRDACLKM